jgi:predicted Zn-dependent protease
MRWKLLLALLLSGVISVGCSRQARAGAETTVAKALISPQEEDQLGMQVRQELEKQGVKYVTDPAVTSYVEGVTQKVLAYAKKARPEVKWKVSVIDDPKTVNAFATPGGYMYVYSGLLLAVKNEAELAGVIGHESGHVALYHSARQIVDAYGLEAAIGLALGKDPNKVASIAAALAGKGTMLKFSRDDETEADEFGTRAMAAAGYDPNQLVEFFQTLEKLEGKQPGILKYLSDHPLTTDRITHLEKYIAANHLSGSEVGADQVKAIQEKLKQGVSSTTAPVAAPTAAPQGQPAPAPAPSQPQQQPQPSGGGYQAPPPPKN